MRHDGATEREAGPTLITTHLDRQPADFADVRATNLAVVLAHVRGAAPCSRADIAVATGLNKATVSSLVSELIGRRLLRETGLTERRIGRPATMIVLDGAPYAAVGLSITAEHLSLVALDLAGERLLSWRRASVAGPPGRTLSAAASLVKKALVRVREDGRQVLGLTVGISGLVDASGAVRLASNLGWRDVPARDSLLRALGDPEFPVTVENDANLAAVAEHRYGGYAGTGNLVLLSGGIGVGAGLVAGGELVRGGLGFAGEIGHLPVDPAGPTCPCGRIGCLEAVASVATLVNTVNSAGTVGPAADAGADLAAEVDEVVRRARAQDKAALRALRETGRHLGYGIGLVANLLNPDVVLVGGYYEPLAPWLLPAAIEEVRARVHAPDAGGVQLAASTLGEGAAATGGAVLVVDSIDAGQLTAPAA
jgi:predicted NBD/HSP70 family sugar kinase